MKLWLTFNEINCATAEYGAMYGTSNVQGFEGGRDELRVSPQVRFQSLHHQLVASAKVVKYAHEHYPDFKMGCMTVYLQTYPATCDPKDQLANQANMRQMVFYTTDVQVRGSCGCWCQRFWEENGVHIEWAPGGAEALREAVIDGVDLMGYTWWGPIDLVSHGTGEMRKRHGFIYVDKYDDGTGDLSRSKKDSFAYYQKLIASNGEDLAQVVCL